MSLVERLLNGARAVLRALFWPFQKGIPYMPQLEAADCSAACLAMVLRYYGKDVRLDDVRQKLGVHRDGANAFNMVQAARAFGLQARGVRLEIEDLKYIEPGSILHWQLNHFVVFESIHRTGVNIVDPSCGRRCVPHDHFNKLFTGVVLLLEPSEHFSKFKGKRKLVWHYLRYILEQWKLLGRIMGASLALSLLGLASPLIMSVLIDRVLPNKQQELLTIILAALLTMGVFQSLIGYCRVLFMIRLQTFLDLKITVGFLNHLVNLPFAFFQRRSAGDLMMRLNSNSTIREILTSTALTTVFDGALVVVYLAVLLASSLTIGGLVLLEGLLQVGVFFLTRKHYERLLAQDLETQARMSTYEVQMFAGIETLKTGGTEQRAVDHWQNLYIDVLNLSVKRGHLSAKVEAGTGILRTISPALIFWVGGMQVIHGTISLGTLISISALSAGFLGPLGSLVSTAMQLQMMGSFLDRIDDVLETPPEQDKTQVRRPGALTGHIVVENVTFRYGPEAADAVQNASLEVKPGQCIAIVGFTGSGKSTLGKLLLGLYVPNEGRVLYDGENLFDFDTQAVRSQLGIVTQSPYLFGSSIRENIILSNPNLPLEAVIEAAKRAHVHDEIAAMPMGYDTVLADGGITLSGGQRQRIALARALINQPRILLLDEATSHLDAVTEQKIHHELSALRCTRVIIAHRLSTIIDADLIFVMNAGRIVERGKHEDLLRQNAMYAELFAAQLPPVETHSESIPASLLQHSTLSAK